MHWSRGADAKNKKFLEFKLLEHSLCRLLLTLRVSVFHSGVRKALCTSGLIPTLCQVSGVLAIVVLAATLSTPSFQSLRICLSVRLSLPLQNASVDILHGLLDLFPRCTVTARHLQGSISFIQEYCLTLLHEAAKGSQRPS